MKFAQGSENDTLWREVLLPQLSEGIDALLPLVKECDVVVRKCFAAVFSR